MPASDKAATWIAFAQVVKSNARRNARFCPHQAISYDHSTSTSASHTGPKEKTARKAARTSPTSQTLRSVAVEAQRSSRQNWIQGTGKFRHVHADAETKDVTAFCTAAEYDLSRARRDLRHEGYRPDPFGTELFPQVLHVQTPAHCARIGGPISHEKRQGVGDVFVFPSGCVVTWNVPESMTTEIVDRFLLPSAGNTSHLDRKEVEDLEYIEDPDKETSRIIGDTIILGTAGTSVPQSPSTTAAEENARDTVLAKIAISSALARSTKLAVLENALAAYFATTRSIPTTLSSGRPLRITRSQILRKTGELLSIRAQLNLYSELTDSLPDLFWDSPHELGLEGYYDMVGKALDVNVRIRVLNEKMDYASEIAAVLRERLSEKHSSMLEWMIIGLICIEVGFGVVHLWREKSEMEENERIRGLVEAWLVREVGKA